MVIFRLFFGCYLRFRVRLGIRRILMVWLKQFLFNIFLWMRFDGRKMRCGRQITRRDSERFRFLRCEVGEFSELVFGDLSMLQFFLGRQIQCLVLLGLGGYLVKVLFFFFRLLCFYLRQIMYNYFVLVEGVQGIFFGVVIRFLFYFYVQIQCFVLFGFFV